jgi:hypothetical protein
VSFLPSASRLWLASAYVRTCRLRDDAAIAALRNLGVGTYSAILGTKIKCDFKGKGGVPCTVL